MMINIAMMQKSEPKPKRRRNEMEKIGSATHTQPFQHNS